MSTDIERRLHKLEEQKHRCLTEREMEFISDDDLDWLASRPAHPDGMRYDFSRWSPDELARADAIRGAAMQAARDARHAAI